MLDRRRLDAPSRNRRRRGSTGLALEILLGAVIGGLVGAAITAAILSRTNARLPHRFRTLSSDALDRNNERFLALASERLGSLERSNVLALAQREAAVDALVRPLRAVAYGWQQEAMAENTVPISKLGRELFERIVTLNDRFGDLGKKLDGAVEAFNAAIGTLESRVHVSARRMAELGVAKEAELKTAPTLDRRTRTLAEVARPSHEVPPVESTQT